MRPFLKSFINHSFGQWALTFLMICLFSGVLLIVPYDSKSAFDSIVKFILQNPFAAFFRNLHYWSAQAFLIFSLLHIADHLMKKSDLKIKTGLWFRLSLMLIVILLTMLSGFFLKADSDSLQARQIFESLLVSIPLIGESLSYFILGTDNSLLIPYIHHVATFSILLLIGTYEHIKQTWPKAPVFILSLIVMAFISSFVHAPLQLLETDMVKGPWYFVGLQEILHFMSEAVWSILIVLVFLIILFLIKFTGNKRTLFIWLIGALVFTYFVLSIIGFYFRGDNWKLEPHISNHNYFQIYNNWNFLEKPENNSALRLDEESCMWCHSNTTGFTTAHQPDALGCYGCHLGNPLTTNKQAAHKDIVNIPGNLSNARQTCATAQCHSTELDHINKSLMTSNSGIVAVDKFVFYESNDLNASYHITELGHTAAETHLRNLCANCHLGHEKMFAEPIHEKSRGGGCIACHLSYNDSSRISLEKYQEDQNSLSHSVFHHPKIDLEIGNDHCFGCHSRSGRISTNYEGWHETTIQYKDYTPHDTLRLLDDKRIFTKVDEDVHHQLGMDCIDCHTYAGIMGDGNLYNHQEEAVKISCEDCHSSTDANYISNDKLEKRELVIYNSRKYTHTKILITQKDSFPILNTSLQENNEAVLYLKNADTNFVMTQAAEVCTADAHQNVSCNLCHSSWAPQCLGCHNEYDANDQFGYDHLKRKQIRGEWNEYIGKFLSEAPVIGVEESGSEKKYKAAVPGMIMTIDTGSFNDSKAPVAFHRLYAPSAPHTTQAKGRDCKSCHLNPLALGFGRGHLEMTKSQETTYWVFENKFALNKNDGLPEDAWTPFIDRAEMIGKSTRKNFRSLNQSEQLKMLEVGKCLLCHDQDSRVMKRSLSENFDDIKKEMKASCSISN